MHVLNMIEYGHQLVLETLEGISQAESAVPGACGHWSIKDIVAHLASYEALTYDVLCSLTRNTENTATPMLRRWLISPGFNDEEVALRSAQPLHIVLDEYKEWNALVTDQLIHTRDDLLRQRGMIPWYGPEYDVEDFLIYAGYAHKREHCAQISAFHDRQPGPRARLEEAPPTPAEKREHLLLHSYQLL